MKTAPRGSQCRVCGRFLLQVTWEGKVPDHNLLGTIIPCEGAGGEPKVPEGVDAPLWSVKVLKE